MIQTEGLSGPLRICGKPLTYSKPIIGNGTCCELVRWTSKDFGLNGAYSSSHTSPTEVKGQKKQVKCVQTSIEQAFIKIKKYDTLESNSLSPAESPLWAQRMDVGEYTSAKWTGVEKTQGVVS